MDRRNFLKTTGTVIAGAPTARSALANAAADANAPAGRLVLPMNRNWRFSRAVADGAHARDFDDSAYERVVIPHTHARLPSPRPPTAPSSPTPTLACPGTALTKKATSSYPATAAASSFQPRPAASASSW